jgi:hypothetical protein
MKPLFIPAWICSLPDCIPGIAGLSAKIEYNHSHSEGEGMG